ncbi:MAG: hypothetical protein PVH15_03845, partial [Syntrophobacterales bacterium]
FRSLSPSMIMNSRQALYFYQSVLSHKWHYDERLILPFSGTTYLDLFFISGLINSRCANS